MPTLDVVRLGVQLREWNRNVLVAANEVFALCELRKEVGV